MQLRECVFQQVTGDHGGEDALKRRARGLCCRESLRGASRAVAATATLLDK